jgi:chitodextrinase
MNFTTPYNTSDYFFTKEQDYIQFNTPLQNTYFEMTVNTTTYDFYTEEQKFKSLVYRIPLFQNKAEFLLGEIIDRCMPRMQGINLRSLFQYKAATVQLTIKEIDYATEMPINTDTVGLIKFIAGYTPEVVENNCAFLDLYELSRRVVPSSYAFVNMILTPGVHNFKVFKNNIEVDDFNITVISSNICSRALKLSNYAAHQGDLIECRMTANPTVSKTFYVFPPALYSNYIAFEDEYRLKTIVECTGEYKFGADFTSKMNKTQKGSVEFSRKISSKTDLLLTIDTGWVLEEEETIIESLSSSKRAWLIIGENQGIELVPNAKKFAKFDPTTALYSYNVEFIVNAINEKPLRVQMDKPLVILEVDDIPPSTPSNLVSRNTTTTGTKLSWGTSYDASGVSGYDIYKGGVYLASTTALTYTVSGLVASTAYTFTVKAKDAAGNISTASNVVSLTTPAIEDTTPPTQPTNLVASDITTNSLKLTWTASTDNLGVTKYNVYRNGIKIGESSVSTYDVTGLYGNTSYSFYVTAQDAAGNISIASASISVTTVANTTETFYFEGRFPSGDYHAPNGGSVTYVDEFGETVTANGFFLNSCLPVTAQSIISTSQVQLCQPYSN